MHFRGNPKTEPVCLRQHWISFFVFNCRHMVHLCHIKLFLWYRHVTVNDCWCGSKHSLPSLNTGLRFALQWLHTTHTHTRLLFLFVCIDSRLISAGFVLISKELLGVLTVVQSYFHALSAFQKYFLIDVLSGLSHLLYTHDYSRCRAVHHQHPAKGRPNSHLLYLLLLTIRSSFSSS